MNRNSQIDGWRCFAVLGVMWLHWAPRTWRGALPFEIGLYFFLTLTGFFITRILLAERARGEESGGYWRWAAYGRFLRRRLSRILIPCYAAMAFAWLVGASDIRLHPWHYTLHLSNFHMAWMDGWPSGTAHYWTLAIQVQFYFFWPLLVFFLPKRLLPWGFVLCIAMASACRVWWEPLDPTLRHVQALTPAALDYFGFGALLAWWLARSARIKDLPPSLKSRWLKFGTCIALGIYAVLYTFQETSGPLPWGGWLQQPMLACGFAGGIGLTLVGFGGAWGRILEHPAVQEIGRLSFGLYLFHSSVPLLLGWVLPVLWLPIFDGPLLPLRLLIFAGVSWCLAVACRRWLEEFSLPRRHRC